MKTLIIGGLFLAFGVTSTFAIFADEPPAKTSSESSSPTALNSSADIWELARSGTVEQISEAIANGADINAVREKTGITPLYLAAAANPNPEMIDFLIAHGAKINATESNGWTPLYAAVAGGNDNKLAITQALIDHGAALDQKSNLGWTPLYAAISGNRPLPIIAALIDGGANVNEIAPTEEMADVKGMTLLHAAILLNRDHRTLTALLKAGADVNAKNSEQLTPLHLAALARRSPKFIRALIAHGANVNAKNANGDTPLDAALTVGNLSAAKLISAAGGQLGDPADAERAAEIMQKTADDVEDL